MTKNFKLVLALALAVMMLIGMTSALATEPEYKITVTPSGSGVTIDGKTFYAYKLFDATYSGDAVAYSINTDSYFYKTAAVKEILDRYFTFTATSNPAVFTVTVKDGTTFSESQAYELTDALNGKLPATSAADGSGVAANDKAEINLTEAGYYIVTGEGETKESTTQNPKQVIAATAVTTAKPTAQIKAKIDAPSIDKTLDTPLDTETKKVNQKAIGDTVNYTIDTKVPDMTGYNSKYFFIVTDHLAGGLTYQPTTLDVKLDGVAPTYGYDVYYSKDGTNYGAKNTMPAQYAAGDELYIKIVFKDFIKYTNDQYISTPAVKDQDGKVTTPAVFTDGDKKVGKAIQIKYDAILNDSALLTGPNENEVDLIYSNNPNNEGKGDTENDKPDEPGPDDGTVYGRTPEHVTKTYVTGIELLKIEKGNSNIKLDNVEFVVTCDDLNDIKETTYERYVKIGDGEERPAENDPYTWYLLKDGTYTQSAPVADGAGKNVDKYEETTANYKLVTENTFSKGAGQKVSYKVKTADGGKITLSGLKAGTYTITEVKTNDGYNLLENPVTVKVEATTKTEGGKVVFDAWKFTKDEDAASTTVDANGRFAITVENAKGVALPSTGGIGTTIFYVAGSIMVLAAAILLITKRRMGAND